MKEKISKKSSKTKTMTKKSKIILIILGVLVVLLAIAIPLGIVLADKGTVPQPRFSDFDQESDYFIWVKWNKIKNADGYFYKYSYGDPEAKEAEISKECYTQNHSTAFERHKGIVAFCVKADIPGEVTEYSDWIKTEIDPWILESPAAVTLDEDLNLAWTPCTFKYNDKTEKIASYKYNFAIDGEWKIIGDITESTTSVDLFDPIVESLYNYEKVMEYILHPENGWEDVEIKVRVKAVNSKWFTSTSGSYASLAKIYDDSEYAYQTLTITEDIYKSLTGRS